MAKQTGIASFQINEAQLKQAELLLTEIKDGSIRAIVRTLNATGKKARQRVVQEGAKEVRITQKRLKEDILGPADRSYNKATFTRPEARLTARYRGYRLINFLYGYKGEITGGTPNQVIKVKVKPTGTAKKLPGAYFLRLKNLSDQQSGTPFGIFIKGDHKYGPSPSQIFNTLRPQLEPELAAFQAEDLNKQIAAILRQYG